jgi:uroporphyrinogen-III synthase
MIEGRALAGLGVVITRPRAAGEALAALLAREGAKTFVFPALEIVPIENRTELDAALAALPECDLAVFVSANAVEHGMRVAGGRPAWPAWPARTRVAAIGAATAEALRNSGFRDVITPAGRGDSETLLACQELQRVRGRNILVFRGRGGRELLRETLEARGAKVTYVECYERRRPQADASELVAAWRRGEVHAVSVLSAETLENFVAMVGAQAQPLFAGTALVAPHPALARHALAGAFGRVIIAAPEHASIVESLATLRIAQ